MIPLYCVACYLYAIGFLSTSNPPHKTSLDIVLIVLGFIFAPIIVPVLIGMYHGDN